jgi:hypothetical protein
MKTYTGYNSGSHIEPVLWNARESVWIISPWVGKNYAKRLALLSQEGIEVRIVTSNVDYNGESIELFQASDNPNLMLLVLDQEKAAFIHSKIYIIDKRHAVTGSANLTYSGLNKNVESLSIAETKEEVQKIETEFMRVWMNFERKRMSNEELSNGTSHQIKNALPLSTNYGDINYSNIKDKELVYYPYYFFEYSFRASAGKSPPLIFANNGFVVLDGENRQIINDNLLIKEIRDYYAEDYFLKTENKYRFAVYQPKVRDFREARELVLDHIIKKNTKHYTQNYGNRSYDRIFVPYRNIIRFIKSGFVQVPVWYIERHESDGRKHQDLIFGSSGKKWNELVYCPECQKKIWINQAVSCKLCGKQVCPDCINEVGLIFKKKLCSVCLSKS